MNDFHADNAWAAADVLRGYRPMRLNRFLYRAWLIRAARRDMRSAAFYVGRAEKRLKAAGLSVPPPTGLVPLLGGGSNRRDH